MKRLFLATLLLASALPISPLHAAPARGNRGHSRPYAIACLPYLRWRTTLGMTARTVPVVADLDLDGATDIVFPAAGETPSLVRLTEGGAVTWRIALPAPVTAGATLGDVNRDGTLDVLVACGRQLLCIDARGRQVWKASAGDEIDSLPTIADLDGDGSPEVLFGSNDNVLHVLNSKGKPKWKFVTKSWIVNGVAVANISGGPQLEVVFGSMDGFIHCLDAKGRELWKYETGDWVESSPAIGDVDNDGNLDVLAASDDGNIYCLSRRGTLKWEAKIAGAETRQRPFVVLADLYNDGELETIVAQQNGEINVLLADGDQAWTVNAGGQILGSPLVADLNGDKQQEIIAASMDGNLQAWSVGGGQLWSTSLGQGIAATPALADSDRDGKWEIFVANRMADEQSGFFSAYEISSRGGDAAWPSIKGDPYRTGFAPNAVDYGDEARKGVDYATSWEPFYAAYRPDTGVQPPRKLRVSMLALDDARGNRDGALDPGETAWVRIRVQNLGKGPSYENTLKLDPGKTSLSLDRNSAYLGWLAPGAAKTAVFRVSAPTLAQLQARLLREAAPKGTFRDVAEVPAEEPNPVDGRTRKPRDLRAAIPASMTLRVYEDGVPAAVAIAQLFKVPSLQPHLKIIGVQVLDGRSKLTSGNGNGNGRLDAGESVVLRIRVRNDNLTTASTATATLASGTKEVLPATPTVLLGKVVPYGVRTLDFGLRVAPQVWTRQASLKLSTYTTTKSGAAPSEGQKIVLPLHPTYLDTTPPQIQFISPPTAIFTTRAKSILLRGQIRDASPLAALLFERHAVKWLPGNRFAFQRKLAVGENVFPIAATDAAGNTTTRWIRVVRKP